MSALISKRYAQALFDFANEKKKVDLIHRDLGKINRLCKSSPEFVTFLNNSVISYEQHNKILTKLLKKRLNAMTFNFLLFLSKKRRLGLLSEISTVYEHIYYKINKIKKATVYANAALSAAQIQAISRQLKKKIEQNVEIVQKQDSEMIGGMKIQIEDIVYDYTINFQLNKFRQSILN